MNILPEVVTEAFGVALVGYVASLALAQASAKKFNYSVDDNQVKMVYPISTNTHVSMNIFKARIHWDNWF